MGVLILYTRRMVCECVCVIYDIEEDFRSLSDRRRVGT